MFAKIQSVATKCGCNAEDCDKCAPAHSKNGIDGACAEVLASVQNRRDNGGAASTVRAKALNLIELLVLDLES